MDKRIYLNILKPYFKKSINKNQKYILFQHRLDKNSDIYRNHRTSTINRLYSKFQTL